MKTFEYTFRGQGKEARQGTLKAEDRAAAFRILEAQGLTPVILSETTERVAKNRVFLAVGVSVFVAVAAVVLHRLFSGGETPISASPVVAAPVRAATPTTEPYKAPVARAPAPEAPKSEPPNLSPKPSPEPVPVAPVAPVSAVPAPRRPPAPVAVAEPEPVEEPEPPKPPAFTTMTDQSLAMILSIPPGVDMPPLPDLQAAGMEDDLVKALQNSIMIEEDDSDELIVFKDDVATAKQHLVAEVSRGLSPADVLHAYVAQHNENADYRRTVVAAFQQLVAEKKSNRTQIQSEMDRINAALVQYDLDPVSADEIGLK
jgi:hypothetical protein